LIVVFSQFSIKAGCPAKASPAFSEVSPNKEVAYQKGYWLFRALCLV